MKKKLTVRELAKTFELLWPSEFADSWDAPGFSISNEADVSKVLLCVDVTPLVLAEAKHRGANLVLSHHPFLLRAGNSTEWDSLKMPVVLSAVRSGISLYAAHTNADVVENGVSDTLARHLNLQSTVALVETGPNRGHGRIGKLPAELSLEEFAIKLVELLPFSARGVAVAGHPETLIKTVALCGGAGDAFIDQALAAGADAYVTSDLRHHPTSDATQKTGPTGTMALVDISHWAAESLWLFSAQEALEHLHSEIEFMVSEVVTDPWSFVINRENDEG